MTVEAQWREVLSQAIGDTIATFKAHRDKWFGREHDLQSYLYHRVLVRAGVDETDSSDEPKRILIRREHRLWKEPVGKQDGMLKEVDLALLTSGDVQEGELRRPVCEVVELKYPVEAITGLTERQDLTLQDVDIRSDRYRRGSRNRFKKKFLEDLRKLDERLPSAVNLAEDALCRIIYFDLVRGDYWESPQEISEKTKGLGMDLHQVGGIHLVFTYVCAIRGSEHSFVWLPDAFE